MQQLESGGAPLLEARKVGKRYGGQVVLDGADLVLGRGERAAIMGPSGSGKSTLLACVAGLERPDSGAVLFEGRDMAAMDEVETTRLRRGRITSIFQFFHLLPTLRAWENVEFPLLLARRPVRERRARVAALLEEVGLMHRREAWPSELSGGEMQRLAIARALITEPALLLADEPTGSLDSRNGGRVLEMLAALTARHGTALLMVTHDTGAAGICERILHMADGRILEPALHA